MQREDSTRIRLRSEYNMARIIFILNQCKKECIVISGIIQVLEKLAAKNHAKFPVPGYVADWDEIMHQAAGFFVDERMDKAKHYNGLMLKYGDYAWVNKFDQQALVEYGQWLEIDILIEISKYSRAFTDQVKKPGMTLEKLKDYYEQLLVKKCEERCQHEDDAAKLIEYYSNSERECRTLYVNNNIDAVHSNLLQASDQLEQNEHGYRDASPTLRRG